MHPKLSTTTRWMAGISSVCLILLLAIASRLTPSASGIGTHEELGLGPCVWIQLAGARCPSCGMTTSWALLWRGELSAALHANPGGVLLFIFAIVSACVLGAAALSGAPSGLGWYSKFAIAMTLAVALVTLVHWLSLLGQPLT